MVPSKLALKHQHVPNHAIWAKPIFFEGDCLQLLVMEEILHQLIMGYPFIYKGSILQVVHDFLHETVSLG